MKLDLNLKGQRSQPRSGGSVSFISADFMKDHEGEGVGDARLFSLLRGCGGRERETVMNICRVG